jgi:hypothetical protein
MEDHVAQKLKQYKTDIKKAGFKEWIYIKVKHLIKRKIRYCWFDQDLLNMKNILNTIGIIRTISKHTKQKAE